MRVSQFEIYRLVQRALEGSGAPYGVDRDGAQSVAWLEARGLPGLRLLAQDLASLQGCFAGLRAATGKADPEIHAGGISAIAYGSAVIDLARGASKLRLRNCRSPIFLLPPAALAGARLWLRWGEVICSADSSITLWASSSEVLLEDAPAEIEILPGTVAAPAAPFLDPATLASRYERALLQGIEIDQEVWDRIGAVAARVQVPASAESRLKGAGGGDANA
jgi:hypothetical protein